MFGEVIIGLKLIKITGIVSKLCLRSRPTLFTLSVCHRSIENSNVFCSMFSKDVFIHIVLKIEKHVRF